MARTRKAAFSSSTPRQRACWLVGVLATRPIDARRHSHHPRADVTLHPEPPSWALAVFWRKDDTGPHGYTSALVFERREVVGAAIVLRNVSEGVRKLTADVDPERCNRFNDNACQKRIGRGASNWKASISTRIRVRRLNAGPCLT